MDNILLQITQQAQDLPEITKYDWDSWQGIKKFLLEQLAGNQLVQGGLILGALTTIGYYLKDIPLQIWSRVKRMLEYSVTIEMQDPEIYNSFEQWLRNNHGKSYRNVKARLNIRFKDVVKNQKRYYKGENSSVDEDSLDINVREFNDKIYHYQLEDWFFVYYQGWPIKVEKSREKLEHASNVDTMFYDSYVLTSILGKRKINKLLEDIAHIFIDREFQQIYDRSVQIYTNDDIEWINIREFIPKPIESIVVSNKQEIIDDIQSFIERKEWYQRRAIPYKRGHLYYGPPGNGKTSLALAIAKHFNQDCYILNMSDVKDRTLTELFTNIPSNSVLLMEDIDRIGVDEKNTPSMNAILNCLDGVLFKEGIVTIMTTNHPQQLDPALIRDGRIDRKIFIGNPEFELVRNYLGTYYEMDPSHIEVSEDQIKNYNRSISMAKVQNICLNNTTRHSALNEIIEIDHKLANEKEIVDNE
jgi:chaperone BCS1